MKKLEQIIGADLSKGSIDLFYHGFQSHIKIKNTTAGFKELLHWFGAQKLSTSSVALVMEHTGLYSFHFENFLNKHQIRFVKVSALAIKRSLGLIRGKNDKIDAQRIARYGFEKIDTLVFQKPQDPVLQRLQMLHTTRERLVKHRASLICAVKEYRVVLKESDPIIRSQRKLIKDFDQQIKAMDQAIAQQVSNSDESVKRNYELLRTVRGVGKVVATATIIKTKNFTSFKNGRKFSCYCGSAPFEHSSGKSIRKKTRISHLADKSMKTLLTQSAKTAIQHDKELKKYYQRRIEMGKSKKSTINVVRNKIINRMFAVIKRQTPFVEQYLKTA
jgi:transposase